MSTVLFLLFSSFDKSKNRFKEIDVERINVLGANGKPVLVITNGSLMPGPAINGKTYARDVIDGRKYMSGMIFFNELGDEVGALAYAGIKKDSANYSAIGHLSFDQWHQNQVLALDYNDRSGNRYAGMRIWDRPENASFDKILDLMQAMNQTGNSPGKKDSLRKLWNAAKERGENGVERMFIGSKNEKAQIELKDKKGNVRTRLYIDDNGEAKLEFLNAKGETIAVLPKI